MLAIPRRAAPQRDPVPTFFCRTQAPDVPFERPFMDLDTGDSFEHTERDEHPRAMDNIQLRSAYLAFVAAKQRNLSTRDALKAIANHAECPLSYEGMTQPVRAPDNMLYEAGSLIRSMNVWKPASPLTREPFASHLMLPVDRRMQQLSAACGTVISTRACAVDRIEIKAPQAAPTPEAMEEGRWQVEFTVHRADLATRWGAGLVQGAVTALVFHSLGMPLLPSAAGGFLFFAAALAIPVPRHQVLWEQPPVASL